jgi:tRNA-(ms[2]io[6]A)-hydroxylase
VILTASDPRWLAVALANLDAVLVDHAHCERKAAGAALALVARYPDQPQLVRALSALAIEELQHFRAVAARLRKRGLQLTRDVGDPYAQALHKQVRVPEPEQQIDRLLVAALIEARSHERLALLAGAVTAPAEGRLYGRLCRAERGHALLFVRLARAAALERDPATALERVARRLDELAAAEARIVADLPLVPRIH